jgi:hypothetical protein
MDFLEAKILILGVNQVLLYIIQMHFRNIEKIKSKMKNNIVILPTLKIFTKKHQYVVQGGPLQCKIHLKS